VLSWGPSEWCNSLGTPTPATPGWECRGRLAPAGVARGGAPREFSALGAGFVGTPGGQARFPGLRTTSTRRTMPRLDSGAFSLASLLDGSSAAVLGADRHERSEERLGYRNGYRSRSLTTQVGDIDLLIPKLRAGSFFPSILEPRRRVDQALYAVIMEAYISGVSTRKVDALVSALGSQSGISKSQVSRIFRRSTSRCRRS